MVSSFPQNSSFFRSTSVASFTYNVPQLSCFPLTPLTRTLQNRSIVMSFFAFEVVAFLRLAMLLMYRRKNFKAKDVSIRIPTVCDAAHWSPCFLSRSKMFANLTKKLVTLSHTPSLSSSKIVGLSTARLGESFFWHLTSRAPYQP